MALDCCNILKVNIKKKKTAFKPQQYFLSWKFLLGAWGVDFGICSLHELLIKLGEKGNVNCPGWGKNSGWCPFAALPVRQTSSWGENKTIYYIINDQARQGWSLYFPACGVLICFVPNEIENALYICNGHKACKGQRALVTGAMPRVQWQQLLYCVDFGIVLQKGKEHTWVDLGTENPNFGFFILTVPWQQLNYDLLTSFIIKICLAW